MREIFEKELRKKRRPPVPHTSVQSTPMNPNRRGRVPRRNNDGVVLQQVRFAASLPYKTPKRKIIQSAASTNANNNNQNIPPEVCEMVQNCTGMIMKSNPVQYQRCTLCSTQTSWYCPGCKRWLCMDRRSVTENQKELNLYSHSVRGKECIFNKSCFHQAHELAWERKKMENIINNH